MIKMIKRIIDVIKFLCQFDKKKECEAFKRVLEIERQIAILENDVLILKERYKKVLEAKRIENMNVGKEKKDEIENEIMLALADLQEGKTLQEVAMKYPNVVQYILKKIL